MVEEDNTNYQCIGFTGFEKSSGVYLFGSALKFNSKSAPFLTYPSFYITYPLKKGGFVWVSKLNPNQRHNE